MLLGAFTICVFLPVFSSSMERNDWAIQESIESAWEAIQRTCPFLIQLVHLKHWNVKPLQSILHSLYHVEPQMPNSILHMELVENLPMLNCSANLVQNVLLLPLTRKQTIMSDT
jgi:hypothetical protein